MARPKSPQQFSNTVLTCVIHPSCAASNYGLTCWVDELSNRELADLRMRPRPMLTSSCVGSCPWGLACPLCFYFSL